MSRRKATIYLDSELHRAPRLRAAETDRKLSGREYYRVRRGDHRIVYRVDDEPDVVVVKVGHRRDV